MGILSFNEQSLVTKLELLSAPFRVLFAAVCAQRLLPAYVSFWRRTGQGDAPILSAILERLWLDLQNNRNDARQLQEDIELSMSLIPQSDSDSWVPEQAWAEDAAAALAYALRCRQTGSPQEAAWAARRGYEALDHFVNTQKRIDINRLGAEEKVLGHPLIQAELLHQQRDLSELLAASPQDLDGVAQRMSQRAKAESETVFELIPHSE